MPLWSVVVTDLNMVPVGELTNFGNFNFVSGLNKIATCSFQVRLDNAHADRLSLCNGYVKVYRNKSLRFFGPIVTAEETVEGNSQSIQVNCADVAWVLGKRVAAQSSTGLVWNTATDRAQVAKALIDTANTAGETRISTTAAPAAMSAGSATTHKITPYKNLLECIVELGGSLDGFDWRILPIENFAAGAITGTKIGAMQALPLIGSSKPGAVFEYGTGRSNVLQYTKTRTRDSQANKVFHVANNAVDVRSATSSTSITTWGLLESTVQAELTDATMRDKLVSEHIVVRGTPRDLIKMTPHIDPGVTGRLPKPFVDYECGDTITFRAVYGGKLRFSGFLRVYGITIQVDSEGFERVELVLEDDS